MAKTFALQNAGRGTNQLCIQSHSLTLKECQTIEDIVCCHQTDHPHHQASKLACVFLQGYQEPFEKDGKDGWILVEFWTDKQDAIQQFVNYLNSELQKL